MTKAPTLWELPRYSTNLDLIPYGSNKPNYKVLIKVTDVDLDVTNDCGDPEPDEDEKKELEADVIGTVFEFDLEEDAQFYTSEYDSEFHFVSECIDEQIADRISDESGWLVNYANWVEVEEVRVIKTDSE